MLNASVTLADDAQGTMCDGWLFQAINSVEITVQNSLISNQVMPGGTMREYLLACCPSEKERSRLLTTAGRPTVGNTLIPVIAHASIPIGWILNNGNGVEGSFPIDMSTLNGPITIQVNFNPSPAFIVGLGTGAAIPATTAVINAFTSLQITAETSELVDSAFTVRDALAQNPAATYAIPGRWLNTYKAGPVNAHTIGQSVTLNLNSVPQGMLEALILLIKPTQELLSPTTNKAGAIFPGSVGISKLRLQYAGQDLFRANSEEQIAQHMRSHFSGDTKRTTYSYFGSDHAADTGAVVATHYNSLDLKNTAMMDQPIVIIPLTYDSQKVMSGKLVENLPDMSNANLQLSFTTSQRRRRVAEGPFRDLDNSTVAGSVVGDLGDGPFSLTVDVLYVLSNILEIGHSAVNMIV
jgi:hypothetical protein